MNRKEEIKRLPFVVSAYKQIYRSESCCGICNLPWSVCGHEHIDITDKYGVLRLSILLGKQRFTDYFKSDDTRLFKSVPFMLYR